MPKKYPGHNLTPEREMKLKEAFKLFVQNHWTHIQFAEYFGVSKNYAGRILSGKVWPHVKRPKGFQYPWPEQYDQSRLIPRAKVLEAFRRYEAESWSLMDFVSFLGVTPATGYAIFRGAIYADIPRPTNLDMRTQRQKERDRAKEALRRMLQEQWTFDQLQEFLGVRETKSVYKLLERQTFPDLFDELFAEGIAVQPYIDEIVLPAVAHRRKRSS